MRGEIRERLRHIPTELNEYGYDPFGLHPETTNTRKCPSITTYIASPPGSP
jgi:hypothetical protein